MLQCGHVLLKMLDLVETNPLLGCQDLGAHTVDVIERKLECRQCGARSPEGLLDKDMQRDHRRLERELGTQRRARPDRFDNQCSGVWIVDNVVIVVVVESVRIKNSNREEHDQQTRKSKMVSPWSIFHDPTMTNKSGKYTLAGMRIENGPDRLTDEIFNHVDFVGSQGIKDQGDGRDVARRLLLLLVVPRTDRRHDPRSAGGRSGKGVERGIHVVEVTMGVGAGVLGVVMRVMVEVMRVLLV